MGSTAENYQLKWHLHLSNLNTSVSTLYRNEKFADVMLLTCNQDGGAGIPAHRIILSSCSHYFANVFENNPITPNSITYIVLPPELSRRSVNILIQYMYSGEATVSNDILNEVLRGGEILKIRGLWRNQNNNNISDTTTTHNGHNFSQSQEKSVIEHSSKQKERRISAIFDRERSTTNIVPENHTIIPKDSPVIVMASSKTSHPPPPPQQQQQQQIQQQQQQQQQLQQTIHQQNQCQPTLIVKKDVAIDPGDTNNMNQSHFGLVSLQIAAAVKKAQQTNEKRCVKSLSENCIEQISNNTMDPQTTSTTMTLNDVCHYSSAQQLQEIQVPETKHNLSTSSSSSSGDGPRVADAQITSHPQTITVTRTSVGEVHIPEALNFLTIKQEPCEWLEYESNGTEKKHNIEVSIKPEIIFTEGDEDSSGSLQDPVYSPLTCELCSATFTVPGDWVRHIENHADSTHTMPKKRRRVDENSTDNIASLRCDLCNTYFVTPAEWVRHVQNIHTETELAISNNSTLPKRPIRTQRPIEGPPQEKSCSICNKTFPSYASMIIHKRTHTGERPFYCSLCNKGFNVKSNLLRHMRTLHNQIFNPSICEGSNSSNNDTGSIDISGMERISK